MEHYDAPASDWEDPWGTPTDRSDQVDPQTSDGWGQVDPSAKAGWLKQAKEKATSPEVQEVMKGVALDYGRTALIGTGYVTEGQGGELKPRKGKLLLGVLHPKSAATGAALGAVKAVGQQARRDTSGLRGEGIRSSREYITDKVAPVVGKDTVELAFTEPTNQAGSEWDW